MAVGQSTIVPVNERRFGSLVGGLALALAGLFRLHNADAFGHLAQGRQIAELGAVPKLDPFSIWKPTAQPWNNYEWASDLLTWWVYDLGGANALILFKCAILFVIGWVLVLLAARLSSDSRFAVWLCLLLLVLAIPGARFRLVVRPQLLGLLFPALLLIGLNRIYRYQKGDRTVAWLIAALAVMQVVWVNSHGSHLLGLMIGGIFTVFAFRTPAFVPVVTLFVLQLFASGCSPFGFEIMRDAIEHVARPEYRAIVTEWEPWSPRYPVYWLLAPVMQSLLLLAAVRPLVRSGRAGTAGAVFCLLLTVMTFRSIRFTAHQLLLTSPFIAAGLASYIKRPFTNRARAGFVTALGGIILFAGWMSPRLPPFAPFGFGMDEKRLPWSSYEFIESHMPNPRIFGGLPEAWVALFALPDAKVLIDGRVPFYGAEFTALASAALNDPRVFDALVSPTQIDAVIIDHVMSPSLPVVQALSASPQWSLVHIEDQHALYVRGRGDAIPPLDHLAPSYDPARVLDPAVDPAAIEQELKRLGLHQNGDKYRKWVHGLLTLRPYARQGADAGLRLPVTRTEKGDFALAYALLSEAHERFRGMASIELWRAMAALGLCGFDEAREALSWARFTASERETALLGLEIDVREGNIERAKKTVEEWTEDPDGAGDPWLLAIAADLEANVARACTVKPD